MLHFRTSTMLLAVVIFTAGCAGEVPAVVEATDPAPALSADPITDGLVAHRPAVPGVHGLITAGHPLAAMAGMRILMQGGTAADAAVKKAKESGQRVADAAKNEADKQKLGDVKS